LLSTDINIGSTGSQGVDIDVGTVWNRTFSGYGRACAATSSTYVCQPHEFL